MPFASRLDFVNAIQKVLNIHGSGNELRKNFIKKVSASFKEQMGEDL